MQEPSPSTTNQAREALLRGDLDAAGHLLPLVYDELRKLAARKIAEEKPVAYALFLPHFAGERPEEMAPASGRIEAEDFSPDGRRSPCRHSPRQYEQQAYRVNESCHSEGKFLGAACLHLTRG